MNDTDEDDSITSKPGSVIQEADSAAAPIDPDEEATRGKPPGQNEAGVEKPGQGGVLPSDNKKGSEKASVGQSDEPH